MDSKLMDVAYKVKGGSNLGDFVSYALQIEGENCYGKSLPSTICSEVLKDVPFANEPDVFVYLGFDNKTNSFEFEERSKATEEGFKKVVCNIGINKETNEIYFRKDYGTGKNIMTGKDYDNITSVVIKKDKQTGEFVVDRTESVALEVPNLSLREAKEHPEMFNGYTGAFVENRILTTEKKYDENGIAYSITDNYSEFLPLKKENEVYAYSSFLGRTPERRVETIKSRNGLSKVDVTKTEYDFSNKAVNREFYYDCIKSEYCGVGNMECCGYEIKPDTEEFREYDSFEPDFEAETEYDSPEIKKVLEAKFNHKVK